MGWASGGEVFDPVAQKLIDLGADDDIRHQVCSVLIAALRNRGWDTEGESLGGVFDDPAIVQAFRDHDITQTCGDERQIQDVWTSCEKELGHSEDIHSDDNGREWI